MDNKTISIKNLIFVIKKNDELFNINSLIKGFFKACEAIKTKSNLENIEVTTFIIFKKEDQLMIFMILRQNTLTCRANSIKNLFVFDFKIEIEDIQAVNKMSFFDRLKECLSNEWVVEAIPK
jgi:hypothetical protein